LQQVIITNETCDVTITCPNEMLMPTSDVTFRMKKSMIRLNAFSWKLVLKYWLNSVQMGCHCTQKSNCTAIQKILWLLYVLWVILWQHWKVGSYMNNELKSIWKGAVLTWGTIPTFSWKAKRKSQKFSQDSWWPNWNPNRSPHKYELQCYMKPLNVLFK
jgi:hypothetical protein